MLYEHCVKVKGRRQTSFCCRIYVSTEKRLAIIFFSKINNALLHELNLSTYVKNYLSIINITISLSFHTKSIFPSPLDRIKRGFKYILITYLIAT